LHQVSPFGNGGPNWLPGSLSLFVIITSRPQILLCGFRLNH
jgi:hypothetical protein